jgi:hypothetical protein
LLPSLEIVGLELSLDQRDAESFEKPKQLAQDVVVALLVVLLLHENDAHQLAVSVEHALNWVVLQFGRLFILLENLDLGRPVFLIGWKIGLRLKRKQIVFFPFGRWSL